MPKRPVSGSNASSAVALKKAETGGGKFSSTSYEAIVMGQDALRKFDNSRSSNATCESISDSPVAKPDEQLNVGQ